MGQIKEIAQKDLYSFVDEVNIERKSASTHITLEKKVGTGEWQRARRIFYWERERVNGKVL